MPIIPIMSSRALLLTFVEKERIGEQEKQDYALDLQEAYDFSEDETKELQQRQITMHTESKILSSHNRVLPGGPSVLLQRLLLYMNTIEH